MMRGQQQQEVVGAGAGAEQETVSTKWPKI